VKITFNPQCLRKTRILNKESAQSIVKRMGRKTRGILPLFHKL